ncbi:MAG: hypothetical protein JNK57_00720 [Planctomycetaceae bacterium]|nr:hypothetical protein [Planctomycetaceae bacterium]
MPPADPAIPTDPGRKLGVAGVGFARSAGSGEAVGAVPDIGGLGKPVLDKAGLGSEELTGAGFDGNPNEPLEEGSALRDGLDWPRGGNPAGEFNGDPAPTPGAGGRLGDLVVVCGESPKSDVLVLLPNGLPKLPPGILRISRIPDGF